MNILEMVEERLRINPNEGPLCWTCGGYGFRDGAGCPTCPEGLYQDLPIGNQFMITREDDEEIRRDYAIWRRPINASMKRWLISEASLELREKYRPYWEHLAVPTPTEIGE